MQQRFFLFLLMAALSAPAASTTTWELNGWQDFLRGKFQNTALTRDGRLLLAPVLEKVADTGQPAIWSAALAADGTLYAGTGPRGQVFRIDPQGQAKLLWTAPQPMVFALALDGKGVLHAGTSPDGKIYRIESNGQAREVYDPKARYIWSLAFAADGTLFAGTGDQGKIHAIRNGRGEIWYDTGQAHITALAIDRDGRLLAGSEPNGILYRVTAKDQAFVLYDSVLSEIRSLSVAADGSIYAAAMGGVTAKRTGAVTSLTSPSTSGAVVAPGTTITVTDEAQAGLDVKPKSGSATSTFTAGSAVTSAATPTVVDLAGVEKSAIYRIQADNTVETLWSSKEENVFDLYERNGELTFATDTHGHLYRLDKERKLALIAQSKEGEITRLFPAQDRVMAVAATPGYVYRLSTAPATGGSYESPVHDANTIARWGKLSSRGEGTVKLLTRTGNSVRPDRTWGAWTALKTDQQIASPNARYLQWKAELANGVAIDSVRAAYLPQNTAPAVKSISVVGQTTASTATTSKTGTSTTSGTSAIYSITVTDTGEASTAPAAGTPTQTVTRTSAKQLLVTWTAEDADTDPLLYSLYYRGDGEKRWKLLRGNTGETSVTLDGEIFADGRYSFRVVASDKAVNAPESARESELVSAPVLVDNTPPALAEPQRTSTNGGPVEFELTATDATSELKRCDYSLDGGAWTLVEASDGVTDSPREVFKASFPAPAAGEHVLVFRVSDVAGNTALRKILFE